MKIRDIAPYGVRMPADLKEKLQERAKKNSRSLNAEIVQILEDVINGVDEPISKDMMEIVQKMHERLDKIEKDLKIDNKPT